MRHITTFALAIATLTLAVNSADAQHPGYGRKPKSQAERDFLRSVGMPDAGPDGVVVWCREFNVRPDGREFVDPRRAAEKSQSRVAEPNALPWINVLSNPRPWIDVLSRDKNARGTRSQVFDTIQNTILGWSWPDATQASSSEKSSDFRPARRGSLHYDRIKWGFDPRSRR